MSYGYMGTILRVDLSTGSIVKQPLEPALCRQYIGGAGFATRILYDETPPGVDPFSPENVLILAASPLAGTLAPGASRLDITTKSPLTGMFGSANSGGFWAAELKYAGYDAIVVRGRASLPVYIWIDDDYVQIRDASQIWGKETWEASDSIKKEFPDSRTDRIGIATIGPAGENLVRFASVTVDYHHSASRSGVGAVMGSKNLKAIAVRGSGAVNIANPTRFEKVIRDFLSAQKEWMMWMDYYGAGGHRERFWPGGGLSTRHHQSSMLPHWQALTAKAGEKYLGVEHACHCCQRPERCVEVKDGKYAGLKIGDIHVWPHVAFGVLCSLDNLPAVYKCDELCERLGMDFGGSSYAIAFAMELYQRKILTKEATDGVDLRWGDEDQVIDLLNKIAHRTGLGDLLAEGSARMAQKIGKKAEAYVVHVGGMTPLSHGDPRAMGWAHQGAVLWIGQLTSPRGGDNVKTTHMAADVYEMLPPPKWRPKECQGMSEEEFTRWYVKHLDVPEDIKRRVYGEPPKIDLASFENKAPLVAFLEDESTIKNCLGICLLQDFGKLESAEAFSACTGIEMAATEMVTAAERVFTLQHAYNAREGITRKDVDFPQRFYTEPLSDGPYKGSTLSKKKVNKLLDEYFDYRGWDKVTGIPTEKKLLELGLEDVAQQLIEMGLLKGLSQEVA